MITQDGKVLVAKYLAGIGSMPFEYIALGCGPKPLPVTGVEEPYAGKALMFESTRILVTETAVEEVGDDVYIILSGSVPSSQRYEYSEIGVYPANENTQLVGPQSKILLGFSQLEDWHIVDSAGEEADFSRQSSIAEGSGLNATVAAESAFWTKSTEPFFSQPDRNYQTARVMTDALMVRGDLSTITGMVGDYVGDGDHLNVYRSPNLSTIMNDDAFSLSFAVLPEDASTPAPTSVKIIVEFRESSSSSEYARLNLLIEDGEGDFNFSENGYYAVSTKISDTEPSVKSIDMTPGFSWGSVGNVSVWIAADGALDSDKYYVLLDGLRFISGNDENPKYKMVAYSVIQNDNQETVVKNDGEESRIVYRLKVDVS